MSTFEQAFRIVVGEEGGFTSDPADPGNWTGGKCGAGRCAGTKFGISAASYPALDIMGLDLQGAWTLYRRDYWERIRADEMPAPLALLMFDAAVNTGVGRAIRWMQQAVGTVPDGILGDATLAAIRAHSGQGAALLAEFQAQRLLFMAALPTWRTFGSGWARRLCRLPYEAVRLGGAG